MKNLLCALAQVNVTVGALRPNAEKVHRVAAEAFERGARLIVFPEMCISGYPPEDLVLKRHFLDDCEAEMEALARLLPPGALTLVGAPHAAGGLTYNAAHAFHGGRRVAVYHKILLPNYGVFDEKRLFAHGAKALAIDAGPLRIGVHICEDSWILREGPCRAMRAARPDVLVNLSASPYHRRKSELRRETMGETARFLGAHVLYGNLVGGQDELVFDGASMALDPRGRQVAGARHFHEDLLFVALPVPARRRAAGRAAKPAAGAPPLEVAALPALETAPSARVRGVGRPRREPAPEPAAEVYEALKLGLRDYVDKNGFRRAVVGLSGGIDSALVATIAADALGPDRVAGVTMPSMYSSRGTRADAEVLAGNLGIEFRVLPIQPLVQAFLGELAPLWKGRPPDATEENLQARVRGLLLMALSNKFGWIVLSTGNKSELATGYCTLYGDMVGGFALIKDVPKTLVFELARWRNAQGARPVIPASTIERPPSAELRPDQRDTDSLPPYEVLDPILERYVERDLAADRIVADGFDAATVRRVIRLVDANEYKRRQGAPGVKITPKAFGRDRRLPITCLYRDRTDGGTTP
jgi:NAD+ synthase (glutamine-hydrolysing)